MKSRTTECESKKDKVIKKKNSYSKVQQQAIKKPTGQRKMKSEERSTSSYLNQSQKKKSAKPSHGNSVTNRLNFQQEFDDYIQSNTPRKGKNIQNKSLYDGKLPIVGNASLASYLANQHQMPSMISSLNNSGILLSNERTSSKDKGSINVHHKPSSSIGNSIPFKGKPFVGMNTAMINYMKDLDYFMSENSNKPNFNANNYSVHHYSVNNPNPGKLGKKKSLMLTSQKSSKRKSVERESIKAKHKRSASDGNRILSSKGRK